MRKIIHIDMDCFYAAIEVRENPQLAGKPVAVGGQSHRGVLTTCNYEARKFGCRSALPTYRALQLCPSLVLLPSRFELYRSVSNAVREILLRHTPLVEPLSLDEAYLDVSARKEYGWDIAKEIRKNILETTKITASAGIAPNKMLAKIASDWRKPNGQFAVTPEKVEDFMVDLPVREIWGIGPKSMQRLERRGIQTCGQLQNLSRMDLFSLFGSFGTELYDLCRGIDNRPVEPSRIRKSLSTERTFEKNLHQLEECVRQLKPIYEELCRDLRGKSADLAIAKAFIKLKFADFKQTTRECVCPQPDFEVYLKLLEEAFQRSTEGVRLIGAGVRFRPQEPGAGTHQLDLNLS